MDCDRDFRSSRALRQHIDSHQTDSESSSSDLSEAASWVTEDSSDEEVQEIENAPDTTLFRCSKCSHGFTSQDALLAHYSEHKIENGVFERVESSEPVARASENVSGFDMLARCVICLHRVRGVLLRPCRHLATCGKCSERLEGECPICRYLLKWFIFVGVLL
jgi:hypothetical protein